MIVLDSCGY